MPLPFLRPFKQLGGVNATVRNRITGRRASPHYAVGVKSIALGLTADPCTLQVRCGRRRHTSAPGPMIDVGRGHPTLSMTPLREEYPLRVPTDVSLYG